MSGGVYSASVVRGGITYIFFNGRSSSQQPVIKLMKATEHSAPTETLKINGKPLPASEGPIAATIVDNGKDGIRLYIVTNSTIVEYGLDSPIGQNDVWVKQGFTGTPIQLDQGCYLSALGKPELGGIKSKGKDVKLRIYYVKTGKNSQVTMQTFTGVWEEETIES